MLPDSQPTQSRHWQIRTSLSRNDSSSRATRSRLEGDHYTFDSLWKGPSSASGSKEGPFLAGLRARAC